MNSFSQNKPAFKLQYLVDEKIDSNKIKINIKTFGYDFYSLYFGTYNQNENPIYKKFNDVKFDDVVDSQSSMYDETKSFEIDKTDFIELINENTTLTSEIFKFQIPKNVSQIFIECNLKEEEKFKLSGIINTSTNELTISNDGRQPLTFIPEKDLLNKIDKTVLPIETKKVRNWTYAGKDFETSGVTEDYSGNAAESVEKPKYQIQVADNLKNALTANAKNPNKFLIIYHDPKNAKAKANFDEFIKGRTATVILRNWSFR